MTIHKDAKLPAPMEKAWLKRGQVPGFVRRALPYQIARSSLFAALPANLKNRHDFAQEEELQAYSLFTIVQTSGTQLVQRDGTVWIELLHLALKTIDDGSDLPIPVAFYKNDLLRTLNQEPDSNNRRSLTASLERLADAKVSVVQDEKSSWSAKLLLIDGPKCPTDRGKKILYIDKAIARSFRGGYTLLNQEQRQQLRHDPLAQWMHAFYSTHKSPRPLNGSLVKRLSGCQGQLADAWEKKLVAALKSLSEVTNWKCRYNFDLDKVHINRGHHEEVSAKKPKTNVSRPKVTDDPNDIDI